ncbi:MAG TPA: T9SS type A sorting domain-containing protein [Bacteroidia bacterium]|jgi:hypothetical protein|nr:T9SS type A sorting domain-containing protein [Bacteroidia bacterium]
MNNFYLKLKITCITLLFALTGRAQTTCAAAVSISYPMTNYTVSSYTSSAYWFTTSVGSGSYGITVTTTHGSTGKFTKADVYQGDCSTYLYTDSLAVSTDSTFIIYISDTSTTTYYIKLTNAGGSSNLNLNTSSTTTVSVVGDLGYCSGQAISLTASIWNAVGTQTYTWTTSGSTGVSGTNSVTVTATPTVSPTTYTLTYHDNNGTLTYTFNVIALPAAMCTSCEMVQNGAFESSQYNHFNINNILLSSTSCSYYGYSAPKSDPKYWKSPTCATPDYYHSSLNNIKTSVPINYVSGSPGTNAHSGNGYGGIITYNFIQDYRDYMQSKLKCALVAGQIYNVSFYTSLSRGGGQVTYNNPTNNIGAYVSTTSVTSTNTSRLPYTPQINSGIINNIGSWTQVAGTITGNGEQYITVGNFYNDLQTSPYPPSSLVSYYFIDDISVTPATPTLTASNCQSGSVTISAYGAPNSTVTTWAGPSSYTATGSSITVASPTTTVTYTCTVNLSTGCGSCSNITQTISIAPQTVCGGTQPGSYTITANGSLITTPAYIANDLYIGSGTVTATYTIDAAETRIAAGKTITVRNGSTLVIDGSWLHVCTPCNGSMWSGIFVESGATVITKNYSIIEDASNAIKTASSGTTTPIPVWNISNTIFNNNTNCIYIDAHSGNLSSNYIYSSIFTCRNIGSHITSSGNFSSIKTDISAATPLLVSSVNPTDKTILGARTVYGIYLNAINYTNPINVGSSAQSNNLFDNLDFGIRAYQTSLTAKNNTFQNLTGNSNSNIIGVGIFSDATSSLGSGGVAAKLIVGNSNTTVNNAEKNYFTNCLDGVYTLNMRQVFINDNTFDNETTATTFTTSGSYVTGQYGVYNSRYARSAAVGDVEQMQYANNTCNNYATAHFLDFETLFSTLGQSTYLLSNTIGATGANYCNYGMYLQQSHTYGANSTSVPKDAINIISNTITNVNTAGVSVNSVNTSTATTGFITINRNTEISVKYNSAATSQQSPAIAAIGIYNSYYTKAIDNAVLKCTNFATYNGSCAQYLHGIFVSASQHSIIYCNTAQYIGEGFTWYGNNASSVWHSNTMTTTRYGLVLRSSAVLGDQGSIGHPIYDVFTNDIINAQTLCDATNPSIAPTATLNTSSGTCTTTTTYQPCTNTACCGGTAYTASGGTVTLIQTSGAATYSCYTGGGGGRLEQETSGTISPTDSLKQVLQGMLDPNSHFPINDYESHWAIQYFVNSVMPSISAMPGYENAKAIAIIDGQRATGNLAQAQGLSNMLVPGNLIENNWKTVNATLMNYASNNAYVLDTATAISLGGIASQCPLTGGSIVYTARAILNSFYGSIIEYPNDCPVSSGGGLSKEGALTSIKTDQNKYLINLYPNPNNGQMQVDYNISENVDLQILDINGNLVCTYNLKAEANSVSINSDKLGNGVYFYRIVKNNVPYKCQKLVIIK